MRASLIPLVLLGSAALAERTPAQHQATTLASLLDRATVVAQVRVLAVDERDPLLRRVVLRGQHAIAGPLPAIVELVEPAGGPSCGRALNGLVPGQSLVAFLAAQGDAMRLVASGARGLVRVEPGLVAHLAALAAARGDRARLDLLVAALDSPCARVADDAAHTLATSAGLESASSGHRATIAAALERAVGAAHPTAPSLLVAARRLDLHEARASLLGHYLDATRPALARALRTALVEIDPAATVRDLAVATASREVAERAVDLLAQMPDELARPTLRALQPALGARASGDPLRRDAASGRPRFRSIAPESVR